MRLRGLYDWAATLRCRLRAPLYGAAFFVVAIGVLFHLWPAVATVLTAAGPGDVLAAVAALAVFIYAYVQVCWPLVFGGLGQRRLIVRALVYAFGVCLYGIVVGSQWTTLGFIAVGLVAAVLPRVAAVVAVGLVLAAITVAEARVGDSPVAVIGDVVITLLFGAIFYALLLVSATLREVVVGREAQAQVAVLEERLRVGRDLHDVVVHSLTAIALKTEVAARLFDTDPSRARAEIDAVTALSGTALKEVRGLVHGYRHISIEQTVSELSEVLASAGVRIEPEVAPGALPDQVEQAFCWSLREGVTNALRHATPTVVRIRVWSDDAGAHLTVVNDGVRGTRSRGGGYGLAGLGERLEAVAGTITTVRDDHGIFTVRADVPAAVVATSGRNGAPS